LLAQLLGQGRALDSGALRSAMAIAFCGCGAERAWVSNDAYLPDDFEHRCRIASRAIFSITAIDILAMIC
jgi:hypothetical protein